MKENKGVSVRNSCMKGAQESFLDKRYEISDRYYLDKWDGVSSSYGR
jgi:hypothetical protein